MEPNNASDGNSASSTAPVRSVTRALTLLNRLTVEGISLTEAAQRADIPLPTALRLMRTLEREGYAQRRDDGMFVVGPSAVMLAYHTDPTGPLRWMIRQAVAESCERTGETSAFFMRSESRSVCVEAVETSQIVRWVVRRGASSPLHLTVPGRLLMAFGATEELLAELPTKQGKYVERNGSLRPIAELRAELDKIRATGVSTSEYTTNVDAMGMAMRFPVEGPCMGTFMIAGPMSRLHPRRDELIEEIRQVIVKAAEEMPFGALDAFRIGPDRDVAVP